MYSWWVIWHVKLFNPIQQVLPPKRIFIITKMQQKWVQVFEIIRKKISIFISCQKSNLTRIMPTGYFLLAGKRYFFDTATITLKPLNICIPRSNSNWQIFNSFIFPVQACTISKINIDSYEILSEGTESLS